MQTMKMRALILLTSWAWSHAKVTMDEHVEMEIGTDSVYSTLNDSNTDCTAWANSGECNLNPEYMFRHCIKSCIVQEELGAIGNFLGGELDYEEEDVEDKENVYYVEEENEDYEEEGDDEDYEEEEDDEEEDYEEEDYEEEENDEEYEEEKDDEDYEEEEDDEEDDECINKQDSDSAKFVCEDLAEWGECHLNPGFMMDECAKACLKCFPVGTKNFEIGVAQEIMEEYEEDTEHVQKTLEVIAATNEYMASEVMEKSDYDFIRRSCRNEHEYCASMAAAGYCEDEDDNEYYYFMMTDCAPACNTCDILELIDTCTPNEADNIFEKGDLDLMFRRMVEEEYNPLGYSYGYEPIVHAGPIHKPLNSKDDNDSLVAPWIVTLDEFLTSEECNHLIELGQRSSDNMDDYEAEELDIHTSLNSWCTSECYSDPVMESIIGRMSEITGIPQENSEYLQMLKYSAGQEYEEYHEYDLSQDPYSTMAGPTVVTVLLFLNNVEDGGETFFHDLSGNGEKLPLRIQPNKGSALIWSSVKNDPSMIEERTLHKFLPVTKGIKYAVKATFHLRSYDHDNCDYDMFNEFRWW